ncbi:MAG: ABC transporter ATP-binding protein [Alphaproteobacteria bacterium]|nr:ABC transporter ATP-binding protein [Alphaproteobacteria bacterium]
MTPVPAPVLSVRDLSVAIGARRVVDEVSFDLAPGEVLALVGESGCGKSMTALALLGLLPGAARLVAGSIGFEGKDLARLPEPAMRAIRGNRASIVFQDPSGSLDPLMTVGDQMAEGLHAHHTLSRDAVRGRSLAMLRAVGISEPERRLAQYPFELSGGMCQRVMIAIALAAEPAILLADEPTTALDVTIQAQILDLMKALRRERGTAILLITHDMGVVADMADRVAVMYAGRIVETGPVETIFAAPRHPYTALLLRSVPRLDDRPKSEMTVIEGSVPAQGDWPPGCRFAPRCPLAEPACTAAQPALELVGDTRAVACRRHDVVEAVMGER